VTRFPLRQSPQLLFLPLVALQGSPPDIVLLLAFPRDTLPGLDCESRGDDADECSRHVLLILPLVLSVRPSPIFFCFFVPSADRESIHSSFDHSPDFFPFLAGRGRAFTIQLNCLVCTFGDLFSALITLTR